MPKNISSPNQGDSDVLLSTQLITNIKAVDPDRYRSAMLATQAARTRLLTLYAFHAELAKVPEMTSEPIMGEIRYQWWREAVDEIYGSGPVRRHEVTTPLASVIGEVAVPRFWFDQLIDGRARDLDPRPFGTLDAARAYCTQTSGKLMQIAVQMAAPDVRLSADQTDGVGAAGLAWGLTGLARSYSYYHNKMLSGLSFEDICDAANSAYAEASDKLGKIAAEHNPAMAYAALVPLFITKLTSSGHDPLLGQISLNPLRKTLRLMGTTLRSRL